ncbi:hypothetical protein FH972_027055 [Carpinus fangiana]|uniref:Protein kinase domain-containing protein n=1 Tax=Carpinus fangiana TaxID=176857 RepID=A0A5N6L649_9ROSI|nr:hypothetical protein FH972_027055 [Carpinus fangiana]
MVGAMGFQYLMLVQLTWVGVLLISGTGAAGVAAQLARPNCPDRCGDVEIPFPFGIAEGCYLNGNFNLSCDHSSGVVHTGRNINITNISIEEGQLDISMYVAHQCFDESGFLQTNIKSNRSLSLTAGSAFTVSYTQNVFVAVGCDTYSYFNGFTSNDSFSMGCLSRCTNIPGVVDGSCSGLGCCKVEIPPGLKYFTLEAFSFGNHSEIWSFNPCSYAFVVKQDQFNFSADDLYTLKDKEALPMVLDWAIGDEICENAQSNSNFVCGGNSTCYDPENSSGYRCKCKLGYDGNPYLRDGCQDIDECSKNLDNCDKETQLCNNSPGGFYCSCLEGYEGDYNGTSCHAKVNKSNVINIALGISFGLLVLLAGGWWSSKVVKKRRMIRQKNIFFKRNGGLLLQQQLSSHEANVENTKLFNSKDLEKATDHFNVNRILGQGGQGTVYKGMLADGRIVVVKKSKVVDEGKLKEFINEVVILSQINHRNVVKLIGCCLETEVPLLVYEYVPNGTLSQYVNGQNEEFPLTWDIRLRIVAEIAGAFFYLHSVASIPIYPRDIKSTNILLDDKYRAKVADFGTSRSITIDQTHLTTLVHGTFGHLDPEYFQSSQFTEKSDVYSFGVILAELLIGEKAISSTRTQESKSLATYFIQSVEENNLFDIIDSQVLKEGKKEEIIAVAKLAKRCLDLNGKKRPTMREVAMELEKARMLQKAPKLQQNYEEHEYVQEVVYKPWEASTPSTMSTLSIDTQPLVSFQ